MLLPEGFDFLLNCGDLFSQGRLEVRGIAALRDRLSGGSEKLLRKRWVNTNRDKVNFLT